MKSEGEGEREGEREGEGEGEGGEGNINTPTMDQCISKLSIRSNNDEEFEEFEQYNEKLKNLCQILYEPNLSKPSTNSEGDKDLFYNLIHLWFNDNSVLGELYYLFRKSGLCFLHDIRFNLSSNSSSNFLSKIKNWANNFFSSNQIQIIRHIGKKDQKYENFDASKYKQNQIDKCEQPIMAIPIAFRFDSEKSGHANMLFIKLGEIDSDGKIPVESEWFEPHGSKYLDDENKSNIIKQVMEKLINLLFSDKKYDIQPIVEPINYCPNVEGLQELTTGNFSGSCAIFAMLYAILKLLNPERSQKQIADDIYKILMKYDKPTLIIKLVIDALTGLLNIKKDNDGHYYITDNKGNSKRLMTQATTKVNNMIDTINSGKSTTDALGNIYEGDFVNGKITGNGTIIWTNGDVYEGDFVDGKRTGKGKIRYANGDVHEGDFVDGKRTGKGKFTKANGDVYEGYFVDGKKTSDGKFTKANGDVYKVFHINGKRIYKDILTSANRDVYEGDFVDGKRTGKGINRYANGDVYEGDFVDGKRTGKGKFTKANGDVYEGDFVDGKRTGKGVIRWTDGNVYEGDFKDGMQNGKGINRWANGDVYEGDFKDGKMTGKGTLKLANGDVHEGDFKDGKMTGKGTLKLANGDVHEGYFEDGKMTGKGTLRLENEDVHKGNFVDGKMTSKGILKHANGKIISSKKVKFAEFAEFAEINGGKKTKKQKNRKSNKTKKQKNRKSKKTFK